jgi:WD40 repeat protein
VSGSPSKPESPYKGLNAFDDSELDALLFFGREREREIVVANLIASRLTVLYGPSGVGKSSLLRAAVARSLRELPEEPVVVVFSSWSDDPNAALAEAVAEATGGQKNGSAVDALEQAQADRDVYLVLDQAEEYFLYHADDSGPGSFADALPAVLTTPFRINVLVSLREDSLAKLDRFTGRIPGLFSNTLRLDRLDRQAAQTAIVKPAERYSELTGAVLSVELALVERVLDEVGTGQIEPALGGLGAVDGDDAAARIEAPYLQLVMQRIWEEERAAGSSALRAETLERLGGAQHIVEEHLEGAMAELTQDQKDLAARLFNHLVTPSGTKIAHDVTDLADFAGAPVGDVQPVLTRLADLRILRSIEEGDNVRYEIFHDVLAQPVLAWRAEHEATRELEAQKLASDRRHRRLLAIIGVAAVALAAMSAVTVYALTQRTEAREQARNAKASELEANAGALLATDPELSLLLASEAVKLMPGETAERSLREALLASRVRAVADVGEPVLAARKQGRRLVGVTVGGDVVRADPTTGAVVGRSATGATATAASFARDGTVVMTGRDGRVRLVATDGTVRVLAITEDATAATISSDGSRVAVVSKDGVHLVDASTGNLLHLFPHRGAESAAISRDNRRVATGGADRRLLVWSGQSGRRIHVLREQLGHPTAIAFSPDGTLVASASTDGIGRVWRTSDWGLQAVLPGSANGLLAIAFSADGEHVVVAGRDGIARVFRADTGAPLFDLAGHSDWVTSAVFTGGVGSPIVTGSVDATMRTWNAVAQPMTDELAQVGAPVSSLAFDDEGRLRVSTDDGKVHVLDPGTGEEASVQAGPGRVRRVVGPDGTVAVIRLNTVTLRSLNGQRIILTGHRNRVYTASFSPVGGLLATASRDHDVRLWDVSTGRSVGRLQHGTEVHDAEFSPDGRWLIAAASKAGLWDVRGRDLVLRLQGHEGPTTAAVFDPTGKVIYTGGADGTVRRYRCQVCGDLSDLRVLADARIAATRRQLTDDERARYLN